MHRTYQVKSLFCNFVIRTICGNKKILALADCSACVLSLLNVFGCVVKTNLDLFVI